MNLGIAILPAQTPTAFVEFWRQFDKLLVRNFGYFAHSPKNIILSIEFEKDMIVEQTCLGYNFCSTDYLTRFGMYIYYNCFGSQPEKNRLFYNLMKSKLIEKLGKFFFKKICKNHIFSEIML
jgi:hypothetical protein